MSSTRFEGRTAVVTGGASGNGQDVAKRLAMEGARVRLWGQDAESLLRAKAECGAASEHDINLMHSRIPIGWFGTLAEVTSLVAWLASEECSFSTGAVFDLSGGRATY